MNNKLAIVGSAPDTRENAPFENDLYDIWSFSDWLCADWLKRCTGLIEIHKSIGESGYTAHPRTPEYWQALQKTDIPVWMYPPDRRVPNAIEYPLYEVLDMIGALKVNGKDARPLNCSVAYAMGLGLYKGYTVIDLYGFDMPYSSGYHQQQPIFTFWIGVATGMGIELNVNCSEDLFIQPLYGIEDSHGGIIKEYVDAISEQRKGALDIIKASDGALQVLNDLQKKGL